MSLSPCIEKKTAIILAVVGAIIVLLQAVAVFLVKEPLLRWVFGASSLALAGVLAVSGMAIRRAALQGSLCNDTVEPPVSYDPGESLGDSGDSGRIQDIAAQMIAAQKAELVGTLAGGIAHNLNNLLMAMHGNAGLLRAVMKSDDPGIKKVDRITEVVNTAAGVIRELMTFARTDAAPPRRIHLNEIMKVCLDLFGRTRKELDIVNTLQKDLWQVHGDRIELEQVILNLLLNASQAMPKAGSLTVTTANVTLEPGAVAPSPDRDEHPGKYVMASIQDSGEGMDDNTLAHLFDPFFTTRPGRAGVGLAFVHKTITGLGGFVRVTSTRGTGTMMAVYLPALEKKEGPDV
ncbi:MAG: ATP-binding protein [Pseudomonadota bacterium]